MLNGRIQHFEKQTQNLKHIKFYCNSFILPRYVSVITLQFNSNQVKATAAALIVRGLLGGDRKHENT